MAHTREVPENVPPEGKVGKGKMSFLWKFSAIKSKFFQPYLPTGEFTWECQVPEIADLVHKLSARFNNSRNLIQTLV